MRLNWSLIRSDLNTPERGGGTTFPRAAMADGTTGAYIEAEKTNAVFFCRDLEMPVTLLVGGGWLGTGYWVLGGLVLGGAG